MLRSGAMARWDPSARIIHLCTTLFDVVAEQQSC